MTDMSEKDKRKEERRSRFRDLIKYRAGMLALIGILCSTYLHSMNFMSQFFYHSLLLGAIAALAIDAGIVAMSFFKDQLISDGELAWMVRTVTLLVLFASGVANLAEGFKSAYGITLTADSLAALDPLTWIQWLAGTIIFPMLAYVMCDTIGTRNLVYLRKTEFAQGLVGDEQKLSDPRARRIAIHNYKQKYAKADAGDVANAFGLPVETVEMDFYHLGFGKKPAWVDDNFHVPPNSQSSARSQ